MDEEEADQRPQAHRGRDHQRSRAEAVNQGPEENGGDTLSKPCRGAAPLSVLNNHRRHPHVEKYQL